MRIATTTSSYSLKKNINIIHNSLKSTEKLI